MTQSNKMRAAFDALPIILQVSLIAAIFQVLHLESSAFTARILPLTIAGFVIHHFLVARWRLPFFALLSLFGVICVFGFANGAWLIGAGLVLIAVAHLPIAFRARVLLLLVLGLTLAFARAGKLPVPWDSVVWPILGSMFMFRLIVYMYDLRHSKQPPEPWRALSYFFLLPNVVFPLFPVVDYATFRRTYFDQDRFLIYQRGLEWMLRGTVHLILYRIVYQHMVLAPAEVTTATDLARYLVANFLLYLRISGQFHLIVGMLHLFGFRLPETHHFFYLASSSTDFWRRINIYWKDFMQKVFYYPAYFRLRKQGDTFALVLTTLFVFFVTWFFHSYQWFWILGKVLLSWTDVLFWSILAVLLVINSLWEMKRGRSRSIAAARLSLTQRASRTVQVCLTFTVICVLWSLWTSATVGEWLALWKRADPGIAGFLAWAAAVALVATVSVAAQSLPRASFGFAALRSDRMRMAATSAAFLIVLLGPLMGAGMSPNARATFDAFRSNELNARDAATMRQGYYENLTNIDPLNYRGWEETRGRPADWKTLRETAAVRLTNDFTEFELKPRASITLYGARLTTNEWGMRDRSYTLHPSDGVVRVALMGTSAPMGVGVMDGQPFEAVVEQRLRRERRPEVEILNFAVAGYAATQQLVLLPHVFEFEPRVLLYVAHPAAEQSFLVAHLARSLARGITVPYPGLEAFTAHIAEPGMSAAQIAVRLRPSQDTILLAVYERMAQQARDRGITPVFIALLLPGDHPPKSEVQITMDLARRAGFEVIDFTDVYAGKGVKRLQIAPWDRHPNAAGHKLIADRLFSTLLERSDLIGGSSP